MESVFMPTCAPRSMSFLFRLLAWPWVLLWAGMVGWVWSGDDAGSAQFAAGDFFIDEDQGVAQVTVTRSGGLLGALAVECRTSDGSAVAGLDYAETVVNLLFPIGDNQPQPVFIPIFDDGDFEGDESLSLELTLIGPLGTVGEPSTAVLTILDDEGSPGFLQFSAPTYNVFENQASAIIEIQRVNGSSGTALVDVVTSDVTTTAGSDYLPLFQTLVFPDGDETPQTIRVDILDDGLIEGPEELNLDLINLVGSDLGDPESASLVIADVEEGTVQFSATDYVESEFAGQALVRVTRSGGIDGEVTVELHTSDGTATAGVDYLEVVENIHFPDGDGDDKLVVIPLLDDGEFEGPETVLLELFHIGGAGGLGPPSQAVLTIQDDDPAPIPGVLQFSAALYNGVENEPSVEITVLRVEGTDGVVSVDVISGDGTATAGADYVPLMETVVFGDGDGAPKRLFLTLLDDGLLEGPENLDLSLVNPTGDALLGIPATAQVAIGDFEAGTVQFGQNSFNVPENIGDAGIVITRQGGADGELTIQFQTSDGTATAGADYGTTTEVLIFPDGDAGPLIANVPIFDDTDVEPNETVALSLNLIDGDGGIGVPNVADLTIIDNDIPLEPGILHFDLANLRVPEDAGMATLAVLRDGGVDGEVSVDVHTTSASALGGDDFGDIALTLVFGDGDAGPLLVEIPIFEDNVVEGDENFTVNLSDPGGGAVLGPPSQALITIVDNEPTPLPGNLVLSDDFFSVNEDAGVITVGVERVGGFSGVLNATLATQPGTAEDGIDFLPVTRPLIFGDGDQSPRAVDIPIVDDILSEDDESFDVILASAANDVVGIPNQAMVTIVDNDVPVEPGAVRFTRNFYDADEGDGEATVTVERVGGDHSPVSVTIGTIAESARAGLDFIPVEMIIHFMGSDDPQTVTIPIIEDLFVEGDETLAVVLGALDGNAVLGDPAQAQVRIQDNDVAEVRWSQAQQRVVEDDDPTKRAVDITLTAVLSALFEEDVHVPYLVGGTAQVGLDHNLVSGTMVFPAGAETASLPFQVIGDQVEEPNELVVVTLQDGDVMRGNPFVHHVIIEDDDRDQAPDTEIISPLDGSVWKLGQLVPLEASGNDPQDDPLQFFWEICSTTGLCQFREGRLLDDVLFEVPGVFVLTCFSRDPAGNEDQTPAQVQIQIVENLPPEAEIIVPEIEELTLPVGMSFTFEGRASDPDSEILQEAWFFLSAPDIVSSGSRFAYTFDEIGTFTLVFRVVDETGAEDADFVNILVTEAGDAPTAVRIDSPADRSVVNVGQPLEFQGSVLQADDAKRKALDLFWALGDGRRLAGSQLNNIVYERAGRYRVRFVGVDPERDLLLEDGITLLVVDRDAPPEVDFNLATDLEIQPGGPGKRQGAGEVFFRAVVADSRGHQNLSFFWDFGDGRTLRTATPGRIQFEQEGSFTVSLYATTASGLQSETVTRTITVRDSNDSRFEPNENFEQAVPLTPGNYDNLLVDEESPTDFFQINVPKEDQGLVIQLSPTGPAFVEVFNPQRQRVATALVEDKESFHLRDLSPGSYFLSVNQASTAKKAGFGYSLGVAVLNPTLYFPEIRVNETFDTQLGIVNPTAKEAALEALGFDRFGNLLESVPLMLAARGRIHQDMGQLFGAQAGNIAWVQVDATVDLVGYSRTESRDLKELYAITANKRLSPELFAPHIAEQTQQWYTRASVINGGDLPAQSQIETMTQARSLNLDQGFSQDAFDFLERFGGNLPESAIWATFREIQAEPLLAGAEVFGTLDGTRIVAGLELTDLKPDNPNFTFIGNNLYFTHIARDVANFWTGIALVNIGDLNQGLKIRAFGPSGEEVGQKTVVLAPGEKLVQVAETFLEGIGSPANVDWVLVEADLQIVGFELFGTWDGTRLAGLEATTALRNQLCYPFIDSNRQVVHGIAVVNVNPQAVTVTFSLYDDDGQVIATKEQDLAAHQKFSDTIEAIFGEIPVDRIPGWLECVAPLPIAGFELFVNQANAQQMGAIVAQ